MSQSVYTNLRQQTVAGSLLKEGIYKAHSNLTKHFHDKPNFCLVLKGDCTERLGSKTVNFKPMTLGLLAPGDEHSLYVGDAEIRCFGIEPAPELIERINDHSLEIKNSEFVSGGILINLFGKIYREFRFGDSASPLAIEGLLLEIIAEAARRQPSKEKRRPLWLNRAEELLRAQYANAPELSAVASAINIHPVHLAREFRRHFKCSIGEYIRRLRVDFASRELSQSSAPLVMIALSAGFADQSHFTREFKRLTGFTPQQYRNLFKPR